MNELSAVGFLTAIGLLTAAALVSPWFLVAYAVWVLLIAVA